MGRVARLEPRHDRSKDLWCLSLPPKLSPTGRRKREYVPTQKVAQRRATQLRLMEARSVKLARKAGADLMARVSVMAMAAEEDWTARVRMIPRTRKLR